MKRRTVWYVWWATAEENQSGTHHKSKPYENLTDAIFGAKLKENTNDFVSIDKGIEEYRDNEWRYVDMENNPERVEF